MVAAGRGIAEDWRRSGLGQWFAERPLPSGFHAQPVDFRPVDTVAGHLLMEGAFTLAGSHLVVGPRGDPWSIPAPSRAFAEALHRFDWMGGLITAGPEGVAEALRLALGWRRAFGRWNAFSWAPAIMSRRVIRLACAGIALAERASEAEIGWLAADLARQARTLLTSGDRANAAERTVVAAIAGAALRGVAGRKLLDQSLRRLGPALRETLSADGGHASRRPDLTLELLFDLRTLDDVLSRRGLATPEVILRAVDTLAAHVRFATLADGDLTAQQGGGQRPSAYVAAAAADDQAGEGALMVQSGGYQRMDSARLQVMVDCAAPAAGVWSVDACVRPIALEIVAEKRRLIRAGVGRAMDAASTLTVGEPPPGRALTGFPGRVLGPRLIGAEVAIRAERHESPGAVWLDLVSDQWLRGFGVLHQRRLYLDTTTGELRGEDRLTPTAKAQGPDGRHFVPYAIRFLLDPEISALVSQDKRSVLLRTPGRSKGWILRNDAVTVEVGPVPGDDRPTSEIVLRGLRRADSGARVRWKLSPTMVRVDALAPSA